jgi:hypothetical protein
VAHVLRVSALQVGHPLSFLILVESDDATLHAASAPSGVVQLRSARPEASPSTPDMSNSVLVRCIGRYRRMLSPEARAAMRLTSSIL